MKISPYICFNGNCKTAFDFYVKNLGARMVMCMTYADAPPQPGGPSGGGCPPPASDKIMHARIQLGEDFIMGSDSPPDRFEAPAGIFVNLTVTDPAEAERLYQGLSDKAQIMMPLGETFWAKKFGMLKDQFGVSWMINCEKESF